MSSTSVRARRVSLRTDTTRATRHSSRAGVVTRAAAASFTASGVALVALLTPWISAVVIAKLLPESLLVARQELQAAHPLRALPEIEMRHEEPRRSAMLGRQRRAVIAVGDPCFTASHIIRWKVRG